MAGELTKYVSFAGIYTETPYDFDGTNAYWFVDRDSVWNIKNMYQVFFGTDVANGIDIWLRRNNDDFPYENHKPIVYLFHSKFFSLDSETLFKRIRNIVLNIYSKAKISVKVRVIRDEMDNSIEDGGITDSFVFNSTEDLSEPQSPFDDTYFTNVIGTQHNRLTVIPSSPTMGDDRFNDWYGKPIKFSVEIEGFLYTNLNQILINIRPIHTYLG